MNDKLLKKRLRGKVAMHMLFGLGGAVVIIGALFKILHLEIGPITGGLVLGLGLGTEALIFTVAALNTGEIVALPLHAASASCTLTRCSAFTEPTQS